MGWDEKESRWKYKKEGGGIGQVVVAYNAATGVYEAKSGKRKSAEVYAERTSRVAAIAAAREVALPSCFFFSLRRKRVAPVFLGELHECVASSAFGGIGSFWSPPCCHSGSHCPQ